VLGNLLGLWFTHRQALHDAASAERTEASGIRDRVKEVLDAAEVDAATVANTGVARPTLAQRARQLEAFMGTPHAFTDLSYVSPRGVELVHVPKDSAPKVGIGRNFSHEPAFQAARRGTLAFGRIRVRTSPNGRNVVIPVAVPAGLGDGGVVWAYVDLESVRRVLTALASAAPGHVVYIVDTRGVVAAHSDTALRLDGTNLSRLPQVRRALAGDLGPAAAPGRSPDGTRMLSYASRMSPPNWLLFVEQRRSEALAPVSDAITRTLWVLLGTLALAVLAAVILARRMVRPIKAIQAAAGRIAGGTLDERIEVRTGDELEALANEFNRMADELRAGYEALEQRVEERTRDLRATLEQNASFMREIEEKNREIELASRHKSAFLANMSHELRTPLNAIIGFSEVLKSGMFGELTPRQADYLQDIHLSGKHLLALINDILDLAKVEAGRAELELADVDMRLCLEEAMSIVRQRAMAAAVGLSLDAAPELGTIRADGRKVKQVVVNLLTNAITFTPQLGEVEVVARREAGSVSVEVRDTGVGIAPEDQERIFREFEQAATSPSAPGVGLGLALARSIVEVHGGRLTVVSELGQGSTFTFTLPVSGPPRGVVAAAATALTETHSSTAAGDLVLVVEDDRRAAKLQSLHLTEAGFEVAVAQSVDEGLELARRLLPVAITLDVLMPGRAGWDFLAEAKSDPAIADIPIVMVSIVDEPLRGFGLGAVDYLVKPVSGPRLVAAVMRAVAGTRRERPRVLVIDDEPSARELASAILESEGFDVAVAADGPAGLHAIRVHAPDLVVLDLLMPGMDGFQVVDELRADPSTAGIPVMVVTAASLAPDERARLERRVSQLAQKGELDRQGFVELVKALCLRRASAV
jgi:signal transduction histidine kinase/DNA-binding response OmpR family regulator